jgi:hypothetical protein
MRIIFGISAAPSVEFNLHTAVSVCASASVEHTGLLGVVPADATYGSDRGNHRIHVSAWIPSAGSFEEPRAIGWLQ